MRADNVTRKMLDEGNRKCLAWIIARGWTITLSELNADLLATFTGPIEEFQPVTREEAQAALFTPHSAELWGTT